MAQRLIREGNDICIVGKAYKPGVYYTIGSSSMLVGHYVEELGGSLTYYDINTGDTVFPKADVYLIGYWEQYVEEIEWPLGSTVVDPWRKLRDSNEFKVVHYGNTRS